MDRERKANGGGREEEPAGEKGQGAFVGAFVGYDIRRRVFQKYRIKYGARKTEKERKKQRAEARVISRLLYLVDVVAYFIFRLKYRFERLFLDDSIFPDTFHTRARSRVSPPKFLAAGSSWSIESRFVVCDVTTMRMHTILSDEFVSFDARRREFQGSFEESRVARMISSIVSFRQ